MKPVTWSRWWPLSAVLVLMAACVSPVSALDKRPSWASLAGLTGVGVAVEPVTPDVERDGLTTAALQTEVELRLRQAGIRVLEAVGLSETPGFPYLILVVRTLKDQRGVYALCIDLALYQEVRLVRNPTIEVSATTWEFHGTGNVGVINLPKARETVRDIVDQFVNDYLAANPKR